MNAFKVCNCEIKKTLIKRKSNLITLQSQSLGGNHLCMQRV